MVGENGPQNTNILIPLFYYNRWKEISFSFTNKDVSKCPQKFKWSYEIHSLAFSLSLCCISEKMLTKLALRHCSRMITPLFYKSLNLCVDSLYTQFLSWSAKTIRFFSFSVISLISSLVVIYLLSQCLCTAKSPMGPNDDARFGC